MSAVVHGYEKHCTVGLRSEITDPYAPTTHQDFGLGRSQRLTTSNRYYTVRGTVLVDIIDMCYSHSVNSTNAPSANVGGKWAVNLSRLSLPIVCTGAAGVGEYLPVRSVPEERLRRVD